MASQLRRDRGSESGGARTSVGSSSNKAQTRVGSSAPRAQVDWLPAQYETVRVARTVRRSVAEVETLLRVSPERVIGLAYGKQPGTSGIVVPLGGMGWLRIPVHVESLTPPPDHHDTAICVRWQARRATRYFPVMEGDLKARPGKDGTTLLLLEGRYRPPLGLLGLIFDQILGRRVASATAGRFVDRIANEIERDDVAETA